jgi:hypothetical protein
MNPSVITGFNPNGSVNLTSPLSPHYLGNEAAECVSACPEVGVWVAVIFGFALVATAIITAFMARDGR